MAVKTYTGLKSKTPQSEPLLGEKQVQNNAGGFVYDTGIWKAFERFLILGTEGGTYYVGEQKLTRESATNAIAAIAEDGKRAVDLIVAISDGGRAVKNDPAVFALALAASTDDTTTRCLAMAALPRVCRIPTHLFHFNAFVEQFRGRGRTLNRGIREWYQTQDIDKLAYGMVKYQSRDGWSHRDLLRLVRPKAKGPTENFLYGWAVGGLEKAVAKNGKEFAPDIVTAFEGAKTADKSRLLKLIADYNLSREMIPTEMLKDTDVQFALLQRTPPHAMLRNLGNYAKSGLLSPLSDAEKVVLQKLGDHTRLKEKRVHPMDILVALKVYGQGHGVKGDGRWTPTQPVRDALDAAFYGSFGWIEPTGKRFLFGVDVSGSMASPIAGTVISSAEAAACLAMVSARTEQQYFIHGFTAGRGSYYSFRARADQSLEGFVDLGITAKDRLEDAFKKVQHNNFGGTDCAVPMLFATHHKLPVDVFVVITDNETWAGAIHPSQALRAYREKMGIQAKEVVIGTTPTKFTIADPKDPLTLDVVGFDTATPQAITEFVRS